MDVLFLGFVNNRIYYAVQCLYFLLASQHTSVCPVNEQDQCRMENCKESVWKICAPQIREHRTTIKTLSDHKFYLTL